MELQSFQVGSVLGRGFGIWLKNFIPFTVLAFLFHLPLFIYTHLTFSGVDDSNVFQLLEDLQTWQIVTGLGGYMIGVILSGALVYGVFEQLRGRHAGIGKCIAVGLTRSLPVLLVGILAALAIGIGFILLIVPGVIIMCILWVAVPAAVVERPGISGALSRSSELTRNYRGQIFLIILVLFVINLVVQQIIKSMGGGIEDVSDINGFLLIAVAIGMLVTTLGAVMVAVGYHDLRATKEGVDVEELARVFD